ncbi:MAG: phosphatase PAP2 family protein [Proteobacteria bacterium]|nr:phosphatase PAP2 family protein [Pseudomonadota bacterium]
MPPIFAFSRARRAGTMSLWVLFAIAGIGDAFAQSAPGYLSADEKTRLAQIQPPALVLSQDAEFTRLEDTTIEHQQEVATPEQWAAAHDDADAYDAKFLLPRFDAAADQDLSDTVRPLLTHLLDRMINDASDIARMAKAAHPRPRPYAEDEAITACNTAWLNPRESFPSGHAMNGYTAALVLSNILVGHGRRLRERGIAYGDHRVLCGVHHPSDVAAGRELAITYFEAVQSNAGFQADLACAQEEEKVIGHLAHQLSPGCAARQKVLRDAQKAAAKPRP